MLKLKEIRKIYEVADTEVHALRGIDLCFRENEFVAILGPSGCGKTTLLNLVGGLDKYTSGDLVINGKSTKEFKDRDWDVYRNHRIGFIFQSYNLIPHQTILGNVELALTISGISKAERIERAKKALDRVGLEGQYYKRPNQLSGGQCQRVAIARALVNEPEILLADEPTGALDTVTSIQIMELVKEIAKERLVIMVTHNPDLADKYANRIVKMLDGKILEDSRPYSEEDETKEVLAITERKIQAEQQELAKLQAENPDKKIKKVKKEKAKMSWWTAFKLSFRNLLSKRGRTILVCFAGAIGIIGVSAVLSLSRGVKDYIESMQDDMLSGNPITIERSGVDMSALTKESAINDKRDDLEIGDWVNANQLIQYLIGNQDVLLNLQYKNEFNKQYVDYIKSMPDDYYQAITLNYGLDITKNIYTDFVVSNDSSHPGYYLNGNYSLDAITEVYTKAIEQMDDYSQYSELITSLNTVMSQCVSNNDYINSQYDVLYGELPTNDNDILIVVDSSNMLTDLLLVQLGYYTQDDFFTLVRKSLSEDPSNYLTEEEYVSLTRFTFEELVNKKFTWYPNDTVFKEDTEAIVLPGTKNFTHLYRSEEFATEGFELNVCGIVRPKNNISYGALTQGFLYSESFARFVIEQNYESEINKFVRERNAYKLDGLAYFADSFAQGIDGKVGYNLPFYWEYNDECGIFDNENGIAGDEDDAPYITMFNRSASSEIMGFFGVSSGSKTLSLRSLGGDYMPESIKIYPNDFANKDLVTNYLDKWNSDDDVYYNVYDENFKEILEENVLLLETAEERIEIKYSDDVEIIISMLNTMIDIITYALVAFTCLALLVSCVMIAIITYVSVMERIKEIGVIRSLGGRKQDVSHLFNAETFIIGLLSGGVGVGVTWLLSTIANLIVSHLSGGSIAVIANLTPSTAIIMIIISVVLTTISGLIPAKSAAKKDPVVALRTE